MKKKKEEEIKQHILERLRFKAKYLKLNPDFNEDVDIIRQLEKDFADIEKKCDEIRAEHKEISPDNPIYKEYMGLEEECEKLIEELDQRKNEFYRKYDFDYSLWIFSEEEQKESFEYLEQTGIVEDLLFQDLKKIVDVVRVRPIKIRTIPPEELTEEQLDISPEWSEIEDNGIIDEEGYIHIKVKAKPESPKYLIHYLIDDILDECVTPTKGRFRKERIEALEVWEKRRLRKPFSVIGNEMGITPDTAKKRFYTAFEILFNKKYNPAKYDKPEIKVTYLQKTCNNCPTRDDCTELCPDVLTFVDQDVSSYTREQTWGNIEALQERQLRKETGRKLPKKSCE
ncbi:MAG: hypothetical protein GTO02_07660 [Candidatus Dadabacteria bacterium]|nr:hypothetical protein [Candidatus Dadabacteria bacterium]